MTEPQDKLTPADTLNKRRAIDAAPTSDVAVTEESPEQLLEALRAGKRSIQSLAPFIPLNVAFMWQTQRLISEAEFSALMAGLEIQEVVIGDIPSQKAREPDGAPQRTDPIVLAFNTRMAGFDIVNLQDAITEIDMKSVLTAKTPLIDGIGIRMSFAKGPDDTLAKPGTPAQLTVVCRAYLASTSMQSTLKCEAVFSAKGMERDLYCRVVVPLPIYKGGRRRLQTLVLDNETRQPVPLPPAIGELFHEKYLFDLRLLKKPGAPTGGLGSAVKGALGMFFNK